MVIKHCNLLKNCCRTFWHKNISAWVFFSTMNVSSCGGYSRGEFTNYVYNIWLFLTTNPPSVYIFYGIKVYKKLIFFTTYPPLLVNVVYERPLVGYFGHFCIRAEMSMCRNIPGSKCPSAMP